MNVGTGCQHRFRDIVAYRIVQKVAKPSKAFLLAPNSNELLSPFMASLSKKLLAEGINAETWSLDTAERARSLQKLQKKVAGHGTIACSQVLLIEGQLIFARTISNALPGNRAAFFLEIDAYQRMGINDPFPGASNYQKLPSTKILVGKPVPLLFELSREAYRPSTNGMDLNVVVRIMEEAANLRGFNLKHAVDELAARAKELLPFTHAIKLARLPAEIATSPLSKREPSLSFTQDDVDAVASMVRMPVAEPGAHSPIFRNGNGAGKN